MMAEYVASDDSDGSFDGNFDFEFEYIPKRFWNLDPVNRAYAQLYIEDILQLEDYPTGEGAFAYQNHPIYRVDILGWVVRVEERPSMFQYGVDDGTGVINCCCWKPKMDELRGRSASSGQAGSFGKAVWSQVQDHDTQQSTCLDLGDILHVRGRVKRYRNRLEVSSSYYRKIEDPACAAQIFRMEELPRLYENVYDRPFVLPRDIAKELHIEALENRSGLKTKTHVIDALCDFLRSRLPDPSLGISNFYLSELETISGLIDIASIPCLDYKDESGSGSTPGYQIRSVIKGAVQKLETEGFLCRWGKTQNMYKVMERGLNLRLDQTILMILRNDCQLAKYEGGCHYLHVMDSLREQHCDFENISPDTVRLAMSRLEERSDVISATSKHFLPFN